MSGARAASPRLLVQRRLGGLPELPKGIREVMEAMNEVEIMVQGQIRVPVTNTDCFGRIRLEVLVSSL